MTERQFFICHSRSNKGFVCKIKTKQNKNHPDITLTKLLRKKQVDLVF